MIELKIKDSISSNISYELVWQVSTENDKDILMSSFKLNHFVCFHNTSGIGNWAGATGISDTSYPKAGKERKCRWLMYLLVCYQKSWGFLLFCFLFFFPEVPILCTGLNTYKISYLHPLCTKLGYCFGIFTETDRMWASKTMRFICCSTLDPNFSLFTIKIT